MSRSYLRLCFQDDGDGTGELTARVAAGGFAGEGGAYFSVAELEAFASSISVYPLPDQSRPVIAGGYWEDDGTLKEAHLAISVYPIDMRGHLGVQVRIATALYEGARPEAQKVAKVEIETAYQSLAKFSRDLIALINGTNEEIVLLGEEFT
ncbi:MAG: hypothetical protein J7M40_01590 [Planctomycetes bacterium]|nr:hypothetical protein [Planctomycetota bacterium]